MADDSANEKTEDPTQKRLDDALEKGDVAKSQEVNTWFVISGATLVLSTFSGSIGSGILAAGINNLDPLCFSVVDFSLAKIDLTEGDTHRSCVGYLDCLYGDICSLLHIFLLEISADKSGVSVWGVGFIVQNALILSDGFVQVALTVKRQGVGKWAGQGSNRRLRAGAYIRWFLIRSRKG